MDYYSLILTLILPNSILIAQQKDVCVHAYSLYFIYINKISHSKILKTMIKVPIFMRKYMNNSEYKNYKWVVFFFFPEN